MGTSLILAWAGNGFSASLCWTLIHSLWQGAVLALAAAFFLSVTRRSPAALRYNVLLGLMAAFLVLVTCTFLEEYAQLVQHPRDTFVQFLSASNFPFTTATPTHAEPNASLLMRFTLFANRNADAIVALWLLLLLVKCVQLSRGLSAIRRMRSSGASQLSFSWQTLLSRLCTIMGVEKKVVLMESKRVHVPLTLGFLKPLILVPAGLLMQLPQEQAEAILLHELAHIRRNDYLVNLLQSVGELFFSFNPAFLWLSARIREEREAVCDDLVVNHTGSKKTYLEALLFFERYPLYSQKLSLGLGTKGALLARMRRLITQKNLTLDTMEKTFLALGIVALATLGYAARPVRNLQARSNPHTAIVVPAFDTVPVQDTATALSLGTKTHIKAAAHATRISDEEKPYTVRDGVASVRSRNGWASAGELTDIIMVDGTRMSPEEVNRTVRRSDIQAVGALGAEGALKRYGINGPVLEIYMHSTPSSAYNTVEDWNQQTVDDVYMQNLKRAGQQNRHHVYINQEQQEDLDVSEVKVRKNDEVEKEMRVLEEKQQYLEDQQRILKEQRLHLVEQQKQAEVQREITEDVKNEMIRDGLIRNGEPFSLSINSEGLYINSQKQPTAVFKKYKALLESKTKQPLEGQHWQIKD